MSERFTIKATGAAAKNYDYVSARGDIKQTNVLESIGHLVKSCLGAGVVAVHEAYMICGLWASLVLNVFLGFAVSYGMHILVKSAQKVYGRIQVPMLSYPDLAEATLAIGPFKCMKKYSRTFRYVVDLTITLNLFGSCCVYQVIIARTVKQLVEATNEITDDGNPPIRVYIAALLIPCVLLCMITHLKYLAPFSIVADFFIVLVALSTIVYGLRAASTPMNEFALLKRASGLFAMIGMVVFSMEGFGMVLPIENHMKEPKKFPLVLAGGMSVVVGMVMIVGFFGYYGFGEKARSPVTINFPFEPYPIVLKVFMGLMIWVTFALNFWVPFDLVWYYLKKPHVPNTHWYWERIYRAIFILVITTIAVIFPNVNSFIGVLGSFCVSNMGFIYPAFIELCLDWDDPGLGFMMWRLWKCVLICAFGLFLFCFGTYTNTKTLIETVFS